MNSKSYPQLQEKYGGKFIAKINNQIIASSKTSKTLWNKIHDRIGNKDMVIEYIEPKRAVCIYGIFHF